MQRLCGVIYLATLALSMSHAASFDCARASTAVEKMICADPELSQLDSAMSARYREQVALKTPAMSGLMEEQRSWLEERNACSSAFCVKQEYLDRMSELTERGKSLPDIAPKLEMPAKVLHRGHMEFCGRLLNQLKSWQGVEVVAPVATADSIDAAELKTHFDTCDPGKFAEHYVIEPRVWDANNLDALSEEERKGYGTGYRMHRGFRLYEINIDRNPDNGKELLLYGARVRRIDGDDDERYQGSWINVVDPRQCASLDSSFVSDVINHPDSFVGVLKFEGDDFFFNAYHHSTELLWSVSLVRPEVLGSAKVPLDCRFVAKDNQDSGGRKAEK